MLDVKPQLRRDAKLYCGRKVRKAFFPDGRRKPQYYFGTVVECPIFDGEVYYKIEYEDGDIEDIAWEELVQIMMDPGVPAASGALADATNLADAQGMLGGKPVGHQPPRKQPNGLATSSLDCPGPSDVCIGMDEPPMQLQGRTRKRDIKERDGGVDGGQDVNAGAQVRTRQCEPIFGEAGDCEAEATERPRKRMAMGRPVLAAAEEDGRDQARAAMMAPEGDDFGGFTPRTVGLPGQIAKIRVENFMCHQHFELEFGAHVTLVSGANGSGKSAIVQALQVCLGVTARNTGRGTAIADLIRTGVDDAKVQVTLWNTGEDAFMPSIFGDRITVERHLRRTGASSYALLDSRGRKAALDRGEKVKEVLDRMLDYFTVDANNALTIITQDKSRSLLSDKSNARDKYEMFMAGTLLDKVQEDLKVANAQVCAMLKNFEEILTRYKAEKQEELQLSSKVEKLRGADKFLQDREMLERAIAWRAVQQMEDRVAAAKAAADIHGPELLSLYECHADAIARAKQDLLDRQTELAIELEKHTKIMENNMSHVQGLLKAEKNSRINMDRAKRSMAAAQTNLEALQNYKKILDDQLAQDSNDKAAEARRLVEEHQKQITEKQAVVQRAVEDVTAALQAREDARAKVEDLIKRDAACRDMIHRTATNVAEFQRQLRGLGAEQDNLLGIFHAVDLNRLIDQNIQSFRQRPIGPLGALLTVTDGKWLLATEVALGFYFRNYLVSCTADAELLRNLMKRAGYQRASAVTTPFDAPMHSIPASRRPANGFKPLLDILIVHDTAARAPVMNYLVDRAHVESIALVENGRQGNSVNHDCSAGPHITTAISMDGDWYRRKGGLRWVDRNGRVRRQHCRLIADLSEYKAALERDLEQTEAQLDAHREDLAHLTVQLRDARAWEAKCAADLKTANGLKNRVNTELHRLMMQTPEMPRFEDDEAGAMLTQLASVQHELASSQIQLQTAEEALALAEQSHGQAVKQAKEEQTRIQEQMAEGKRLREQQTEAISQLAELDARHSAAVSSREQVRANLAKLHQGVEVAVARLRQALAAANQVCSRSMGERAVQLAREFVSEAVQKRLASKQQRDRQLAAMGEEELRRMHMRTVEASMDYAGLEKQLAIVNSNLANAAAEAGSSDLQELEIRLAAQSKTAATWHRAYKRMEEMMQRFQTSYANQMQSFERLRTSLMDITQAKFAKYLRRRDHDGKLEFNHTERTLKLLVRPKGKNNRDVQAVEDLKQLSGGERSFTTVALLLAIGENTESPFRCNDEFDVFMDDVNRRVATETLLEFAMEHSMFQYIFLTPQGIATVEDARQQL
ncbi:hypothetical protein VaNZ11_000322, partial [Volvox africanus]